MKKLFHWIKAWQPTVDNTTTPPTCGEKKPLYLTDPELDLLNDFIAQNDNTGRRHIYDGKILRDKINEDINRVTQELNGFLQELEALNRREAFVKKLKPLIPEKSTETSNTKS